jgi:hypothetical protein
MKLRLYLTKLVGKKSQLIMEAQYSQELAEKVLKGFRLAREKLVEKAKRDDETLVIVRDGKIVHVKARDL